MEELKFYKLNAVPATWEANAFYLINGTYNDGAADVNYAETYVTSSAGIPRAVGNATMIDEIISKKFIGSSGLLKASSGVVGTAVSGTDIKTIAANSILGSGSLINITISATEPSTSGKLNGDIWVES